MRRSVILAILNSRFAFLEADLENPNLKKDKPIIHQSVNFSENVQIRNKESKAPNNLTTIHLKTLPIFVYVNAVPADIYSAAIFLLVKNL